MEHFQLKHLQISKLERDIAIFEYQIGKQFFDILIDSYDTVAFHSNCSLTSFSA